MKKDNKTIDITIDEKKLKQEAQKLIKLNNEKNEVKDNNPAVHYDKWESLITFIKKAGKLLIPKIDYYSINKDSSPSLSKAGAEKICFLFGVVGDYKVEKEIFDLKTDLIYYRISCTLRDPSGIKRAEGYGSASNHDTKAAKKVKAIVADNAILKMAKKKALVDAALNIGMLSGDFTQDLEEMMKIDKTDHFIAVGKFQRMGLYTLAKSLYFPNLKGKANDIQKAKASKLVNEAVKRYNGANGTKLKSGMDEEIKTITMIEKLQLMINIIFKEEQNDKNNKGSQRIATK